MQTKKNEKKKKKEKAVPIYVGRGEVVIVVNVKYMMPKEHTFLVISLFSYSQIIKIKKAKEMDFIVIAMSVI